MRPNFYITEQNFRNLAGSGYWAIQDVPAERAEQVRGFLNNADTIAVFASGVTPREIHAEGEDVGGIDWVRLETNRKPGEPPLNVYHYVIKQPDNRGFPVYGPFKDGAIAPHWSEL